MAINYTTVETMQKGGIHNIALRGRAPAQSPIDRNALNVLCEIQRTESRSYIVVQTQPGENPWDRGVWENLKDIMGDTVLQWLLPWKMSPCTVHNDSQGEFKWGPVVTRLMDEHNAGSAYGRSPRSRRRQSSRTTRSVTHVHV
jgi:palmitoyltransferase